MLFERTNRTRWQATLLLHPAVVAGLTKKNPLLVGAPTDHDCETFIPDNMAHYAVAVVCTYKRNIEKQ